VENESEDEIEFFQTDEMYALTDKVRSLEYIDSDNLDYHIGGETKEDLEYEINYFMEDLHGEMKELRNFINENFKGIKIKLPTSVNIDMWIKHYKESIEKVEDNLDKYKTPFWVGYNKGEMNAYKRFVKILERIKDRIES
jgi:hypothetical protein